jgi:hypothetical protein
LIGTQDRASTPSQGESRTLLLRLKRTSRGLAPNMPETLDPRDIIADDDRRLFARTSSAQGPTASAACVPCVIIVTAAARAVVARSVAAASTPAAAAGARALARAAVPIFRAGAARNFPRVTFPLKRLEAKFKHAPDFGVPAVRNAANFREFEAAIRTHMNNPGTQRIFGSIKGKDGVNHHAVHFYDPLTRKVATFHPNGEFWTAYNVAIDSHATRLAVFGHLGKVGRWA